jgi:hypothetical protein
MFSTPLICCSIGVATVSATSGRWRRGSWRSRRRWAGAISGYWLIGSENAAIVPTITMTIEMTAAKTGRSMKKWANFIGLRLLRWLQGGWWARVVLSVPAVGSAPVGTVAGRLRVAGSSWVAAGAAGEALEAGDVHRHFLGLYLEARDRGAGGRSRRCARQGEAGVDGSEGSRRVRRG